MSLGSRITRRGKAAIVTSLASTPREPLLFLYPQWMRSSSTPLEPTFVRHGRAFMMSSRQHTPRSSVRFSTTSKIGVESPYETHPVEDEQDIPADQNTEGQSHDEKSAEEGCTPVATSKMVESHTDLKIRISDSSTEHSFYATAKLRRKISKSIENAQASALAKSEARQAHHAVTREQKQSWIPDWRVILACLRRTTPRNDEWLYDAVHISVPKSARETLLHGVDGNVWNIADTYGCSVELGKRDTATKEIKEFRLSGSAQAISKAIGEIVWMAPKSKIRAGSAALLHGGPNASTPQPTPDSDDDAARNVISESRLANQATRSEKIERPAKWTTQSLADYIDDLTSMQLPNHMHHLLYKKGEEHVESVVEILRDIITNPECKSSLSRTAFKKILSYFVTTSHFPDAKATFVHMETMGVVMDPEVFNIMLRGTAKNEDLHNFQFILHLMLQRGVLPNGHTWLAFLMANTDFRIKTHIVAAMKQKGLLGHISIMRGVCEQLVVQEISAHLDLGQSLGEFLKHMDSRYGPSWLTVDSGNRILHVLGMRRLISHCWDFLQVMEARRVKIDQVSINSVLNQCKQASNVAGAVEFMKRLPSLTPVQPDEDTYHSLFELAWRTRSYNLARVVWKYACSNAATSWRMRSVIKKSLMNAAEGSVDGESINDVWQREIGIVCCSTVMYDPPTRHPPALSSDAETSGLDLERISGILSSMSRPMRGKIVRELLKQESELFQCWTPLRPFGEMLEEAWERDQNWWMSRKRSKWRELDWKVKGVVHVPIQRLDLVDHGHKRRQLSR